MPNHFSPFTFFFHCIVIMWVIKLYYSDSTFVLSVATHDAAAEDDDVYINHSSQDTPHPKTQEKKKKKGSTQRGSRLHFHITKQTNSSLHKVFTFNLFPSASFFPSLHLFSFGLFHSCTLQPPLFNPLFLLHPSSLSHNSHTHSSFLLLLLLPFHHPSTWVASASKR